MSGRGVAAILALAWSGALALACASGSPLPLPSPADADAFRIIAHRGASAVAPENTLPAFERALELGAREVELDVQRSRDGVAVLFHDGTLDEKTDLAGAVGDHDAASLLAADVGSWFDANHRRSERRYAGTTLARLDGVFERFGAAFHYHVEMKSEDPALPAAVLDVVAASGMRDRVTLSSFHLALLRAAHAQDPEIPLAWLVRTPPDLPDDDARVVRRALVESAASEGFSMLAFPAAELDAALVDHAHARGLEIRAWKVTSEKLLAHTLRVGADGATVDWPDRARRVLEEETGR